MRRGLMFLIFALALFGACGSDDDNNGPGPPATTTASVEAEVADLAVTFVRVDPGSPSLGQTFSVSAQVGNVGDTTSDKYDMAGTVRNISTGDVYPVGAETMDPMDPGEQYTVLQNEVNVADAGSYQFWLEITPWGDDADESNNTAAWSFVVSG